MKVDWLEITLKTSHEAVDALSDYLADIGVDGLIIDDETDFLEFLADNRDYWDYVDENLISAMRGLCQIRFFIENGPEAQNELIRISRSVSRFSELNPGLKSEPPQIRQVCNEDWENNWKEFYKPFDVGNRLHIRPFWADEAPPSDRICLTLDPGMIFGTGTHASTRMCLEALEEAVKPGDSVLDLGSGSGILSIASILLGAREAVGVDIDPKAGDIAEKNAAYSGLSRESFRALTGNILTDECLQLKLKPADLVLANIVADVILALSPVFSRLVNKGGCLICSGILESRSAEISAALKSNGFSLVRELVSDGWVCIELKR